MRGGGGGRDGRRKEREVKWGTERGQEEMEGGRWRSEYTMYMHS